MQTDASDGRGPRTDQLPRLAADSQRPAWMTAMSVFCLASVGFLVWRDLFLPRARDVEVWLGFEVHGAAALLTAPIHWALFLIAAWGFWTRRRWIVPCAAFYAGYVALSHLIWNVTSPMGRGLLAGVVQLLGFSVPGALLLYAHRRERRGRAA